MRTKTQEVDAVAMGVKPHISYSYRAREYICSTGFTVGYGNTCKEAYQQWRRIFIRSILP